MTDAKIIYFPGCEMPQVEVGPEDFDEVRAAIEQALDQGVSDIGQAEDETEWIVKVNELVEMLLRAALRKSPDG
jgi:hypothetical protein